MLEMHNFCVFFVVVALHPPRYLCCVSLLPFTVVALVILLIAFCCIRRCCRKRRPKDAKKGMKGAVDLKSVQLLGNAYKEKVRLNKTF